MNVLNTVLIGVLVSAASLILGLMTTGLRHELADFRKEIKAELRATEQRLDGRIDGFQVTVDGMRSDLTQVALAVGVKAPCFEWLTSAPCLLLPTQRHSAGTRPPWGRPVSISRTQKRYGKRSS